MISKQEFDEFRQFLERASGIVLGEGKHYLVSSRLAKLLQDHGLASISELIDCIKKNHKPGLREQVVDAMTTNETMWFRDRYPYEMLKQSLLPEFAERIKTGALRIWSAACSTGQEPYSISMIVEEYLKLNPGAFARGVQIVATDISPSVLAVAKQGRYDKSAIDRGISEERKQRFFDRDGDYWVVKPEIKSRVSFRQLNLQQSFAALAKFDLIFCRNVLIYFSSEFKRDILERQAAQLNPGGYLMLGSSEAPTRYTDRYVMVRMPQGVIYRLKDETAPGGRLRP